MKRVIKSTEDMINKYDLYIQVDYINLAPDRTITSDSSFQGVPNSIYGKWDAFIINIENLFDEHGFEIAEQHSSNRSSSLSQYYAIYPAGEDESVVYEVMMVLRISDHALPRGVEHGKSYYERYAQQHKRPSDKVKQRWKFEQILVDGKSQESFQEATEEVENLIDKWALKANKSN